MRRILNSQFIRHLGAFLTVLAFGLGAGGVSAAPVSATPNQYSLHDASGRVSIDYSTTSFTGVPMMTFTDGAATYQFSGDQIRVQDTDIGQVVTAVFAIRPDVNFQSISLLVPEIGLGSGPLAISTRAIVTTHNTPFIATPFVGQREVYKRVISLKGTADQVQF